MNYNFIFNTEAEYTAAKASGGSIYVALQTNKDGYLSRSAASFCRDTGKTYIDGVNIIASRDKGEIGDCLIYNTTKATYSWLKGTNAWNASALGSCTYVRANLITADYVMVGYLVHKNGLEDLIVSTANLANGVYCTDTKTVIPGITVMSNIARNNNTAAPYLTHSASGDMYKTELQYSGNIFTTGYPIPRVCWEGIKTSAFANTNEAGRFRDCSWTVTAGENGLGVASIKYKCIEGWVTINPADFDWDFDKWYRKKVLLRFPTNVGVMTDFKGKQNTLALVASELSTPVADTCNSYGLPNVPDFVAGKWWLPSAPELWFVLKNYKTLNDKGCHISNTGYWTSSQKSGANAWFVQFSQGYIGSTDKDYGLDVRAVAAFRP